MKTSLIITAGLAILVCLAGWRNQSRISSAREEGAKLEQEAIRLGITLDSSGSSTAGSSPAHRQRPDREAAAKTTAGEVIAFAKEMEALQKEGKDPDSNMERFQERVLDLIDRMSSLDSAQLKALITEFRNTSELGEDTRTGLIAFSVMTLSKDHPGTALELFTEASDIFPDKRMNKQMVSGALDEWAKKDPDAALKWFRDNQEKHADLITEDAKHGLLRGIAVTDPKRAFKLMAELGTEDASDQVNQIIRAAKTSSHDTAAFEAFRGYLEEMPGSEKPKTLARGMQQFASHTVEQGFENAAGWITSVKPTQEELVAFAGGVSGSVKNGDQAKWIGWMSENLSPESSSIHVGQLVRQWTRDDYKAAGEWLISAKEGATKDAAIQSYAETVAPYEPDTAAQWALTLPEGKQRTNTLKRIHQQLKGKDAAAAEAFAAKHGIK